MMVTDDDDDDGDDARVMVMSHCDCLLIAP